MPSKTDVKLSTEEQDWLMDGLDSFCVPII